MRQVLFPRSPIHHKGSSSFTGTVMLRKIAILASCIFLIGLPGCQTTGPRYKNAGSFSEGLAPVQANNGRWGYIDSSNRWVIPPRFDDAKEFKAGRAAVMVNGKWGYINKRGDWQ